MLEGHAFGVNRARENNKKKIQFDCLAELIKTMSDDVTVND